MAPLTNRPSPAPSTGVATASSLTSFEGKLFPLFVVLIILGGLTAVGLAFYGWSAQSKQNALQKRLDTMDPKVKAWLSTVAEQRSRDKEAAALADGPTKQSKDRGSAEVSSRDEGCDDGLMAWLNAVRCEEANAPSEGSTHNSIESTDAENWLNVISAAGSSSAYDSGSSSIADQKDGNWLDGLSSSGASSSSRADDPAWLKNEEFKDSESESSSVRKRRRRGNKSEASKSEKSKSRKSRKNKDDIV